jgi:tetratricopeptide (TPR) repeat protein
VDTDVLQGALDRFRDNEELEDQLEASVKENDQIRKERERLRLQLPAEKDKAGAEDTRKKLGGVLAREEANEETHRIWTALAYAVSDCTESDPAFSPEQLTEYTRGLDQAIKTDPRNQRAHYLLAALYQKSGDLPAAEREVRLAIQRNPSNPVLHMKLGILLRARGGNDEALKEFHFVERLRPRNTMTIFYTGMTLKDLKRCGLSVLYLQRFLADRKAARFPKKREEAAQAINDCGGARGGYQRRVKHP